LATAEVASIETSANAVIRVFMIILLVNIAQALTASLGAGSDKAKREV
jgi:hypothetical protein